MLSEGTRCSTTSAMDELRKLSALLSGIARKNYYGDEEITDELLKEQIYPDVSDDKFQEILAKSTRLVKTIATSDMDFNQLEAFLTSFMKKKESNMTSDEAKAYVKFWKNHRSRIHDSLVSRIKWNDNLKSVNWRVDIVNKARHSNSINQPVTIVELELQNRKTRKIQFEMDERQLQDLLDEFHSIKDKLSSYT